MIICYNDITESVYILLQSSLRFKQGRKRPLDTPKKMIERREREKEREERKVEGEI